MNDQVLNAFITLIKTGGNYAIWGILAYYGIGLLKVGLIGIILIAITNSIFKGYERVIKK